MTRAPASASRHEQVGAATACSSETTRRSSKGRGIFLLLSSRPSNARAGIHLSRLSDPCYSLFRGSRLSRCALGRDAFNVLQYDLGSPSTCSARYERMRFVEIGATE